MVIPDPESDEDISTLLGVVQPPETEPNDPPDRVDRTVREAVAWVDTELSRLRKRRSDLNRDGLADIAARKRRLVADRKELNRQIANLVAEQDRLAKLVRVLDRK